MTTVGRVRVTTTAPRRTGGLLVALSGNMLLDALEVATMIVALPSFGAELRLGPGGAQWLVSAFALGFGGALWWGPHLVTRVGRRRAYLAAVAVFALASSLSGVTGDLLTLVVLRLVKGCCAAVTATTGVALIGTAIPPGRPRERALSVYTLVGASGFSAGLLLSGGLTTVDWRWTVAAPALPAVILLVIAARSIPAGPPTAAHRPSVRELARLPGLVRAALVAGALNGSYWAMLLVLTYHLDHGGRAAPLRTGIALLPAAVPLALSAPFAGRLVRRVGAVRLVAAGMVLPPLAGLWLLPLSPSAPYHSAVLPALLLMAAAFVLAFAALHVRATEAAPPHLRGAATALYQTAVQLTGALCVVAAGTLLAGSGAPGPAVALAAAVAATGTVLAWTTST